MSAKLPISRVQRDLSDSTVLRNIGSSLGYSIIAFDSLKKGLEKLEVNKLVISETLNNHWELLSEPLQTIMRFNGHQNPYESLKDITRGKKFTKEAYLNFVKNLDLPKDTKSFLLNLTPEIYIGNSKYMAKNIREFLK